MNKNTEKIFHTRYKKLESGCWEWTAQRTPQNYGRFFINYRGTRAHRYSYEIHKGKIPEGMCVCHTCDNPSCVNPDHLWLGTRGDNNKDRTKKGRGIKGETHHQSKLIRQDIREIRLLYKAKILKQIDLARIYKITQANISLIIKQKIWNYTE